MYFFSLGTLISGFSIVCIFKNTKNIINTLKLLKQASKNTTRCPRSNLLHREIKKYCSLKEVRALNFQGDFLYRKSTRYKFIQKKIT